MQPFYLEGDDVPRIDALVQARYLRLGQASISAAHLMGGCRMGVVPAQSVTDPWGKVHGHPDLYVADASLFPAASEVNPHLTIMALADRVAEGLTRDRGAGA
jgi:choline dehydrogenase-like flavoprotein